MAEYLHPGVYVQEVPSVVRPIEGVSTSTAAFVGITDKGPVPGTLLPTGRPAYPGLVTSFTDYTRRYGGFRTDSFLTYAVQAFFQNGGQRLYVIRVAPPPPSSPPSSPPVAWDFDRRRYCRHRAELYKSPPRTKANGETTSGYRLRPARTAQPNNFKLLVKYGATLAEAQGNVVEAYDNVTFSLSPTLLPGAVHPADFARTVVNSRSEYIAITNDFTARPADTPLTGPGSTPQLVPLVGGNDGDTSTVNFIGAPATSNILTGTGLFALDKITDVNLIAIPGEGDIATVNAGIAYCKNQRPLQDCFFIGDIGSATSVPAARRDDATPDVSTIAGARAFATSGINGALLDRSAGDYGAIYYPWVWATDPIGAGPESADPASAIAVHGGNLRQDRQLARRVQSAGRHRSRRRGSALAFCPHE